MKEVLDLLKLGLLIVSPFAVIGIIWFIIARFIKKDKPSPVVGPLPTIPYAYIARRVMYKEELKHIHALNGELAYVLKENHVYMYDGKEWLKVEKHGTMGN